MTVEWDIALTEVRRGLPYLKLSLPGPLSRALIAQGYNRARLAVTDEGLLLTPYVGAPKQGRNIEPDVPLPDWKKGKR